MADAKISQLTGATTPLAGTEVLPLVQSGTTKKVSVANLTAGRDISNKTETATPRNGAKPTNGSVVTGMTIFNDQDNVTGDGVALVFDHSWDTPGTQSRGVKIRSTTTAAYGADIDAIMSATYGSSFVDVLRLRGNGNVSAIAGNFKPDVAGKGLDLSANTPAAGMTSQLLNWYEEGTWTMGFSVASGSVPVKAGFSTGLYTRIGRQVTVTGLIVADPVTTPSGLLKITGLPFTCANSDSAYAGVAIYGQGFTGTVNSLVASVGRNSTTITIKSLSAGAVSDIGAYMTEYSQFIISATYFV